MKRIFTAAVILSVFLLSSCGQAAGSNADGGEQAKNETSVSEIGGYSFDKTTFYYEKDNYDMTARSEAINSILPVTPAGEKLVIECHAGPKNNIYCIFDTKSQTFAADLAGNHLTWNDNDIATSVYSFWSDVCAYDGSIIKSYDLAESEFIHDLALSDDGTRLTVTIMCADGTERIDTIDL